MAFIDSFAKIGRLFVPQLSFVLPWELWFLSKMTQNQFIREFEVNFEENIIPNLALKVSKEELR